MMVLVLYAGGTRWGSHAECLLKLLNLLSVLGYSLSFKAWLIFLTVTLNLVVY